MSLALPLTYLFTARGHAMGCHQNKTLIASRCFQCKNVDGKNSALVATGSPWNCQVFRSYICVAPGGFEGRLHSCAHTHTEQRT